MHGPSTVAAKPRRKTSPVAARWTTSSAGISPGVSRVQLAAERNGSTDSCDGLAVLLAGSEPQRAKGEPRHGRERSARPRVREQRGQRRVSVS